MGDTSLSDSLALVQIFNAWLMAMAVENSTDTIKHFQVIIILSLKEWPT